MGTEVIASLISLCLILWAILNKHNMPVPPPWIIISRVHSGKKTPVQCWFLHQDILCLQAMRDPAKSLLSLRTTPITMLTLYNRPQCLKSHNSDIYRRAHITTVRPSCEYLIFLSYLIHFKYLQRILGCFHARCCTQLTWKCGVFFVWHHLSFLLLCSLNRETEKREGVAWWRLLWDLCGRWGSC